MGAERIRVSLLGIAKNWVRGSDMVVAIFPAFIFMQMSLQKILSIKVLDEAVIQVGKLIVG